MAENAVPWLEWLKAFTPLASPIVMLILGWKLLGRIEAVKATVERQSEYDKKWADRLYECVEEFVQTMESYFATAQKLVGIEKGLDALPGPEAISHLPEVEKQKLEKQRSLVENQRAKLAEQIFALNIRIPALHAQIRRSVVFCQDERKRNVNNALNNCIQLVDSFHSGTQIDLDALVARLDELNRATRAAHGEMLGLLRTKRSV